MNNIFKKAINEFKGGKFNILFLKKVFKYAGRLILKLLGNLIPISYIVKGLSFKPLSLNLSTINICNSRCVFCAYQYLTAPQGIMSDEVFKKAVNDFVDIGGGNIGLTPTVGEILLDPQIIERIKYCRSFSSIKDISFTTNGISFASINLKQLLISGVNTITVSMGGFDRESYKKLFRVDCFDEVYKNTIRLCEINKSLGKPVKILISLRTYKSINQVIKEPAYKKIHQLVDVIDYQYNFDSWSGKIKQSDLFGFMKLRELEPKHGPCSMFYADGSTVLWNGDVTVCGCRDLNGDSDLILGNIMETSLIELWKGEKMEKLRQNFWVGEMPDICRDCSHYYSVKNLRTFHFLRKAKENLKS